MNSKDIFEDVIYFLKILLIDETNNIHKQLEDLKTKFINIETTDDIKQIEDLNTSTVIINLQDEELEKKVELYAKTYEDKTFILIVKNQQKSIKLANVHYVSNLKTIENKLIKIYKDKYQKEKLLLNFSNNTFYNIKPKKLYDENNNEIHLTQRELDLLMLLLKNTNSIVLHKTIQTKIWHQSYEVSESAYKSLLNKLRGKIGKKSIKSISRKGYVITFS